MAEFEACLAVENTSHRFAKRPRGCTRSFADLTVPLTARTMTRNLKTMHSSTTIPARRVASPRCLTLLTVLEAADYASVSTQTVRRWIRAGDLRILRAGRQIRIDESDLVAYLHRHDRRPQ